jgi:hypothetical protein
MALINNDTVQLLGHALLVDKPTKGGRHSALRGHKDNTSLVRQSSTVLLYAGITSLSQQSFRLSRREVDSAITTVTLPADTDAESITRRLLPAPGAIIASTRSQRYIIACSPSRYFLQNSASRLATRRRKAAQRSTLKKASRQRVAFILYTTI